VVLLFEMTSVVETPTSLIYVIEHMETNLSEWVRNEYTRMVKDVGGGNLLFTNMKPGTNCPSFDSDEMSFLSTATLVSETFQEYHDAKDGDRTKAVLLDEKSGTSCNTMAGPTCWGWGDVSNAVFPVFVVCCLLWTKTDALMHPVFPFL
jgi:hypothetical protein